MPQNPLKFIVRDHHRDTSDDILLAAYATDNAENRIKIFFEKIYNRRHHAHMNSEYLGEIIMKNFAAFSSTFVKL